MDFNTASHTADPLAVLEAQLEALQATYRAAIERALEIAGAGVPVPMETLDALAQLERRIEVLIELQIGLEARQ